MEKVKKEWKPIKMREKCKTCKFRGDGRLNGCDYILIKGHSRGCKAENCTVYEKGARITARAKIPWSREEL